MKLERLQDILLEFIKISGDEHCYFLIFGDDSGEFALRNGAPLLQFENFEDLEEKYKCWKDNYNKRVN